MNQLRLPSRSPRSLGLALLTLAFGCADDGGSPVADASADVGDVAPEVGASRIVAPVGTPAEECPSGVLIGSEDFGSGGVCAPHIPAWECPEGWLARPSFAPGDAPPGLGAHATCEPPEVPEECAPGTIQRLSSSECEPHGTICPLDGGWHVDDLIYGMLPAEFHDAPLVFVAPGGREGAVGTRDDPLPTIAAALQAADDGSVIALAEGRYDGGVDVRTGVAIVGACVSGTTIRVDSETGPVVGFSSGGPTQALANLSIDGGGAGVQAWNRWGTLHLTAVRISQSGGIGLWAARAGVVANVRDVLIQDGLGLIDSPVGLQVSEGARVTARGLTIANCPGAGILLAQEGSAIEMEDALVSNTLPGGITNRAHGVTAMLGSTVLARRLLVQDTASTGVSAFDAETTVSLRDAVVRRTTPAPAGERDGVGVSANAATVSLDHVLVDESAFSGLMVLGEAVVSVRASMVDRTTRPINGPQIATGVTLLERSQIEIAQTVIARGQGQGLAFDQPGGLTVLTDVAIVDSGPSGLGGEQWGVGLFFANGILDSQYLMVADAQGVGIAIRGAATQATLLDTAVLGTSAQASTGFGGYGSTAAQAATVTFDRAWFSDNTWVGVGAIQEDTTLTLRDVVVADTASHATEGSFGRGIQAQGGAELTVERGLVRDHVDASILIAQAGTTADLENIRIDTTRATACSDSATPGCGEGVGLAVLEAEATIRQFLISGSAQSGLQVSRSGHVEAQEGLLEFNTVGLNIQVGGFDIDRWFENVTFDSNVTDVSLVELPTPSLTEFGGSGSDP